MSPHEADAIHKFIFNFEKDFTKITLNVIIFAGMLTYAIERV